MKTTLSTISFLLNKKLIFTYFILLPFINIALLVLLNAQLGVTTSIKVAVASIVMSGVIQSVTIIAGSFVYDCNIGVDREVLSHSKFSLYYWGCKFIAAYFISLAFIVVSLLLVLIFTSAKDDALMALMIAPIMLVYGVILGFGCAITSWGQNNPYFWSNFISSIAYPLSGTVIVYSMYPAVIGEALYFLPFSRTIGLIHTSNSFYQWDMIVASLLTLIFILIYSLRINSIKNKGNISHL